jgi:hypothetical protein
VLCYGSGVQKDVEVRLGPGDGERLEAVVADPNSAQKHVWRAWIILWPLPKAAARRR